MPIYLCQPGSSSKEPWRHGVQVYERPFPLHDDEGEQDNHQKQQRSSSSSGASGSGGGPRQIVVMLSSPSEKMPTLRRYITEYCTSPSSDRILIFCNGSYGGEGGTNGTSALAIAKSLIRGEGEEGGYNAASLSANNNTGREERLSILEEFVGGRSNILVVDDGAGEFDEDSVFILDTS